MILRLIDARQTLGMKRQIFFAALGGFDTHDAQLDDHEALLRQFSTAVADFHQATADLGIADRVTLFTASDFNRTYNSNGKGSDHAWGGHIRKHDPLCEAQGGANSDSPLRMRDNEQALPPRALADHAHGGAESAAP